MRCLFEINGTELLSSFLKNETKDVSLEKNYYFHTPTKKIYLFLKHKYIAKCSSHHKVGRFQTKYFGFSVKNQTS